MVKPNRYTLLLKPDLETLIFAGDAQIDFEPDALSDGAGAGAPREVRLDALDLAVTSVVLTADGQSTPVDFHHDGDTLVVDAFGGGPAGTSARPSGAFSLRIAYTGEINDKMAGFYRSRYTMDGEERFLAITQFEERDARRAFPCIDHPAAKAVFDVSILTRGGALAIANTPAISVEEDSDGTLYRFEPTPPMSTYLVFFGVGPFDCRTDDSWRVPIRVAVSPGKGDYALESLEYARKSLSFLEEYTGIPYPLGKMDLIGVTDFSFGAMENFGAISFRENYVLTYPDDTGKRETERMMGISAHEVAHMWFGDLVSPAEWKYVWLNEAYATLFGNITSDHWYPDWRVMDSMLLATSGVAMERDSYTRTIPIEFADGTEVDIDASTAPIIYQKGAAVLTMVQAYLGTNAFGDATRAFLLAYSFSSATTEQFIDAFARGAGGSAGEVGAMLRDWIRRPGVPVVTVARDGDTVRLSQQQFVFPGGGATAAAGVAGTDDPWPIPITALLESDGAADARLMLTGRDGSFQAPGAGWVKLNAGQSGYYRAFYQDQGDWERLGAAAAATELPPRDRFGLVSDLDAFVRAGMVPLGRYLDYVDRYVGGEDDFLVLVSVATALSRYDDLLGGSDGRSDVAQRVREIGRTVLAPHAKELLSDPYPGQRYEVALLRDAALGALVQFGDPTVSQASVERAKRIMRGERVHPDLFASALGCAIAADPSIASWAKERLESPDVTETRTVQLLAALGSVRDLNTMRELLDYLITNVPYRNRLHFLRNAHSAPAARELLWPWFVNNFEGLSKIHPYHLGATISTVVPYGGLGREAEVSQFLTRYRTDGGSVSGGVIDLALDRLAANAALLQRS